MLHYVKYKLESESRRLLSDEQGELMESRVSKRVVIGLACCLLPAGAAMACPVLQDGLNVISGNSDFQVTDAGTISISFDTVAGGSISDTEFSLYAAPNYVGSGT